jgi:STE24 endopeptidase
MTGDAGRPTLAERSRRYSTIKYSLTIAETFSTVVLLAVLQWSGFSAAFVRALKHVVPGQLLVLPLYLAGIGFAYYILEFPLAFYHSFLLEHQFGLTRQRIGAWFLDQAKGGLLTLVIGTAGTGIFLYFTATQPRDWWWLTAAVWVFFSLVLAQLAPVIIIPLFFKYKELSDETLRLRILALAGKMRLALVNVFEINLSAKTEKANAALVGWGKTRRVLLADTLTSKYTPDEIETVVAHEFAHQRSQHLLKIVGVNAAATFTFFFLLRLAEGRWSLDLGRLENLPLLLLAFTLWGLVLQPATNAVSRAFERSADSQALAATGKADAFVSAMEKLGQQNLADRDPHPVIKFIFFDHPSIQERVARARRQ